MTAESTSPTPASPPIVAATSAILSWEHKRGGTAHCLIRLRTIPTSAGATGGGLATVAVASELRDNRRGRDFARLAEVVLAQLIPPMCPPDAVTWYAHHGEFSSYDDAGPETLTRIDLRWDGQRYVDDVRAHHLLTPNQAAEFTENLHLEPVEQVLEKWSWEGLTPTPLPQPRRGGS
jgi:hypothetical protein